MENSNFSENKRGSLVSYSKNNSVKKAFNPYPLTQRIRVNKNIIRPLQDTLLSIAQLDGYIEGSSSNNNIVSMLIANESFFSTKIDNPELSLEDLQLGKANYFQVIKSKESLNLVYKVINLEEVITSHLGFADFDQLHKEDIFDIHRGLYKGFSFIPFIYGDYRKRMITVGDGFIPAPYQNINNLMENLYVFLDRNHDYNGLILAFIAHYQFEAIHPFIDGNGLVGRLLTSMVAKKYLSLYKFLFFSETIYYRKKEYIFNLSNVCQHGSWENWFLFNLKAILHQTNKNVIRIKNIEKLLKNYKTKIIKHFSINEEGIQYDGQVILLDFIDTLWRTQVITYNQYMSKYGVSRKTAHKHFLILIELGIIKEKMVDAKSKLFQCDEMLNLIFSS